MERNEPTQPTELHAAMRGLMLQAASDARLLAEMARAQREFFGGEQPSYAVGEGAAEAAGARFAEWYLLERQSEVLGDVPLDALPAATPEAQRQHDLLRDSVVGVFAVLAVDGGEARVRDLQDQQILDVASTELRRGDALVGRLYAGERGQHVPSPAMAVQRPGTTLAHAFERDVRQLDLERRLTQAELEHLLFRRLGKVTRTKAHVVPAEHVEASLQTYLDKAGKGAIAATDVSQALKEARSPGPVMGPLLDEVAFDTDADLDTLRRLLLELWNAHHATDVLDETQEPPPAPGAAPPAEARAEGGEASSQGPPGETLGERIARRIEAGIAGHEDMEAVFRDVAAMLGEDPDATDQEGDEEGDEDHEGDGQHAAADGVADAAAAVDADEAGIEAAGGHGAGALPQSREGQRQGSTAIVHGGADADEADATADEGDLEALVQEYVWETGAQRDEAVLMELVRLQHEAPVPQLYAEHLTALDLLRLLLQVYLQAPADGRADAVRSAFATLQRFAAWAATTQDYHLDDALAGARAALVDDIERLQGASQALRSNGGSAGTSAAMARRPSLSRVVEVLGSDVELAPASGDDEEHRVRVPVPPEAARVLQPGDLVLAALAPVGQGQVRLAGMAVVMPAAIEPLLG